MQDKLMVRMESRQNAAMAIGTELEPIAREEYFKQTGRDMKPACLQSSDFPWLRASVDGIDYENRFLLEIKCGQSAYRKARSGSIPDYYMWQLQHILAVTGYQEIDYFAYWPNYLPIRHRVVRNNRAIKNLLEQGKQFWELIGPDVERRLNELGN